MATPNSAVINKQREIRAQEAFEKRDAAFELERNTNHLRNSGTDLANKSLQAGAAMQAYTDAKNAQKVYLTNNTGPAASQYKQFQQINADRQAASQGTPTVGKYVAADPVPQNLQPANPAETKARNLRDIVGTFANGLAGVDPANTGSVYQPGTVKPDASHAATTVSAAPAGVIGGLYNLRDADVTLPVAVQALPVATKEGRVKILENQLANLRQSIQEAGGASTVAPVTHYNPDGTMVTVDAATELSNLTRELAAVKAEAAPLRHEADLRADTAARTIAGRTARRDQTVAGQFKNIVEGEIAELPDAEQWVAQLVYSGGAMAPSMVIGAATAGVGSALGGIGAITAAGAQTLQSAAVASTLFSGVYSGSYKDSVANGIDYTTAARKALGDALIETGTEMLIGGMPGLGKGVLDDLVEPAIKRAGTAMAGVSTIIPAMETVGVGAVSRYAARATAGIGKLLTSKAADVLFKLGGEAVEEMVAEFLTPYLDRATVNPNAKNASMGDILLAGLGGALMAGFFQAGSSAISSHFASVANEKEYRAKADELWFTAQDVMNNGVSGEIAQGLRLGGEDLPALLPKYRTRSAEFTRANTNTVEDYKRYYEAISLDYADQAADMENIELAKGFSVDALANVNPLEDISAELISDKAVAAYRADHPTAKLNDTAIRRALANAANKQLKTITSTYDTALAQTDAFIADPYQFSPKEQSRLFALATEMPDATYEEYGGDKIEAAKAEYKRQADQSAEVERGMSWEAVTGKLVDPMRRFQKAIADGTADELYGADFVKSYFASEYLKSASENGTLRVATEDGGVRYQSLREWVDTNSTDGRTWGDYTENEQNELRNTFVEMRESVAREQQSIVDDLNYELAESGNGDIVVELSDGTEDNFIGKHIIALDEDGKVHIVLNRNQIYTRAAAGTVVSHELVHEAYTRGAGDEMNAMVQASMSALGRSYDDAYIRTMLLYTDHYLTEGRGLGLEGKALNDYVAERLSPDKVAEETAARFVESLYGDTDMLSRAAKARPGVIYNLASSIMSRIRGGDSLLNNMQSAVARTMSFALDSTRPDIKTLDEEINYDLLKAVAGIKNTPEYYQYDYSRLPEDESWRNWNTNDWAKWWAKELPVPQNGSDEYGNLFPLSPEQKWLAKFVHPIYRDANNNLRVIYHSSSDSYGRSKLNYSRIGVFGADTVFSAWAYSSLKGSAVRYIKGLPDERLNADYGDLYVETPHKGSVGYYVFSSNPIIIDARGNAWSSLPIRDVVDDIFPNDPFPENMGQVFANLNDITMTDGSLAHDSIYALRVNDIAVEPKSFGLEKSEYYNGHGIYDQIVIRDPRVLSYVLNKDPNLGINNLAATTSQDLSEDDMQQFILHDVWSGVTGELLEEGGIDWGAIRELLPGDEYASFLNKLETAEALPKSKLALVMEVFNTQSAKDRKKAFNALARYYNRNPHRGMATNQGEDSLKLTMAVTAEPYLKKVTNIAAEEVDTPPTVDGTLGEELDIPNEDAAYEALIDAKKVYLEGVKSVLEVVPDAWNNSIEEISDFIDYAIDELAPAVFDLAQQYPSVMSLAHLDLFLGGLVNAWDVMDLEKMTSSDEAEIFADAKARLEAMLEHDSDIVEPSMDAVIKELKEVTSALPELIGGKDPNLVNKIDTEDLIYLGSLENTFDSLSAEEKDLVESLADSSNIPATELWATAAKSAEDILWNATENFFNLKLDEQSTDVDPVKDILHELALNYLTWGPDDAITHAEELAGELYNQLNFEDDEFFDTVEDDELLDTVSEDFDLIEGSPYRDISELVTELKYRYGDIANVTPADLLETLGSMPENGESVLSGVFEPSVTDDAIVERDLAVDLITDKAKKKSASWLYQIARSHYDYDDYANGMDLPDYKQFKAMLDEPLADYREAYPKIFKRIKPTIREAINQHIIVDEADLERLTLREVLQALYKPLDINPDKYKVPSKPKWSKFRLKENPDVMPTGRSTRSRAVPSARNQASVDAIAAALARANKSTTTSVVQQAEEKAEAKAKAKAGQLPSTPQSEVDRQFAALGDTYGHIDGSEVPQKSSSKRIVGSFAQTVYDNYNTTDQMKEAERKLVVDGALSYTRKTNADTEARAQRWFDRYKEVLPDGRESHNLGEAAGNWIAKAKDNLLDLDGIAQGELLMTVLAEKARTDEGLTDAEINLWQQLVVEVNTNATRLGQAVQAIALLKTLTPGGRAYHIMRSVSSLADEYDKRKGKLNKDISGILQGYEIPENLSKELASAKTTEELDAVEEKIIKDIADKIPPTLGDRATAWRYLCMLGNARTHLRNIFSNTAMAIAGGIRYRVAALGEDIFMGKSENRTKTIKATTKAQRAFASHDYQVMKTYLQTSGKTGFRSRINEERRSFGKNFIGKGFEWLNDVNNAALEGEDAFFLRIAYTHALANFMAANNLTAEYLSSRTEEANKKLGEARDFAAKEAWNATYRSANFLADWLNKLENHDATTKAILGGLVPFKRTPINILKTGLKYSPAGILNGIKKAAFDLRSGKATGADVLNALAEGLTGTGILALGIFLGGAGLMKAGGKDNSREEYYDQMLGEQEFSVNILGRNYTLDWLTPISMPLFAGVAFATALNDSYSSEAEGDEDFDISFNNILSMLAVMTDPVTNLSLLQGINDALSSYQSNKWGALGISALEGYALQHVPTMSGQILRTIDPVRRSNWGSPETDMPGGREMERFLNRLRNKSLIANYLLGDTAAYVDMWGREELRPDDLAKRAFEQLAAPWYAKDINRTPVDNEIANLYSIVKDRTILPATPGYEFSLTDPNTDEGVSYKLNAEEYEQYKKNVGQLSYAALDSVFRSPFYSGLSTDEKAAVVRAVYRYAKEVAQDNYAAEHDIEYTPRTKTIEQVADAKVAGLDIGDYFTIKEGFDNITSDKYSNGKTKTGSKKRNRQAYLRGLGLDRDQSDVFFGD